MSKKNEHSLLASPPHSVEAEITIVGSVLLYGETSALHILTPDHFYDGSLRAIFEAGQQLLRDGKEPDFIEMCNVLEDNEKIRAMGGTAFLADLGAKVVSPSFAPSAIRVLQEKYAWRLAAKAASELSAFADDAKGDVKQIPRLVAEASRKIAEVIPRPVEVNKEELITELQTVDDKIPTGFAQMDALLEGGLEKGWLFLIAARPSVGKSSMATTLVGNFLKNKTPVALVSLEMSQKQVMKRVLSAYFEVEPKEAVENARAYIERIDTPYYIHTGADLPSILQQIYTSPAPVIIIDYFGLITMKSKENRFQQMDEISRSIKVAAMEAGKSVILLTQLNREVEKDKTNRQPRLSDLWGGGEKDADQISFLHDPNAKEELNAEADSVATALGGATEKDLEWILRKNRHGPTGYLKLSFEQKKFLMREVGSFVSPPPSHGRKSADADF